MNNLERKDGRKKRENGQVKKLEREKKERDWTNKEGWKRRKQGEDKERMDKEIRR